jgi:hypothetical protein
MYILKKLMSLSKEKNIFMKLVERVLHNISSEEINDISSTLNISISKINSVITILIPGILSAFKAHIVSSMSSGDVAPLLNVFINSQKNMTIKDLFSNNHQALDMLYNRINEFSGIATMLVPDVINALMPTISQATLTMLQEYSVNSLIDDNDNNYIQQLITNDNGYENAINDANKFLCSVFNTSIHDVENYSKIDNVSDDNFVQNLFNLFDQNNDGSVIEDIYHILIR